MPKLKVHHDHKTLKFPDGFLWGAATSAHQVEGNNVNNDWWAWEQKKDPSPLFERRNKGVQPAGKRDLLRRKQSGLDKGDCQLFSILIPSVMNFEMGDAKQIGKSGHRDPNP